jgi:hypothetical protein
MNKNPADKLHRSERQVESTDNQRGKIVKRRTFCRSALATAVSAALPVGRILAVTGDTTADLLTDIRAVTGDGDEKVIERAVVRELAASLSGQVLLPSSEGYDAARQLWNGMIDKHPALIVQCRDVSDVTNAVNLASNYELLTAVRGGGHSAAGKSVCEGGIMIDLSQMQNVSVDPDARSARIEPGILLGTLDQATQAYGLATPGGVVSHTGASGLTLGGGFGKLSRKYGLTVDNTRYFDVVTAAGEFKRANVSENADLFWGLRGGGGNFGIVTAFEYQLHPVGTQFLTGSAMHPLTSAKDVLTFVNEFQSTAPNEVQISATSLCLPNGKGFVSVSFFYNGDPAEGEKVFEPLLKFGKPANVDIGVKDYLEIQSKTDRNVPRGNHYYQKSAFMENIEPGLIDVVVDILANPKPIPTTVNFTQVGGAISEIENEATAYANRDAGVQIVLGGSWPKPSERAEEFITAYRRDWKAIEPFTDGFYINNMMGDEGDKKIRANFGGNYGRLVELKNKYDPTNLFRLNANVKPTV